MRRLVCWFGGGLALAAAFDPAWAAAPSAAPPRIDLTPCPVEAPAEGDRPALRETARCGRFVVPENRALPNGRQLSLKVIVLPARSSKPLEPVFVLAGGPGQPATELTADFIRSGYREDRDVVLMDTRGTDAETGLACDLGGSDADPQGYLQPIFAEGVAYAACRAQLAARADLTQYAIPLAMQDLDDLRRALGYEQVVLDGGSFGTRYARAYIRQYGRHVRAAILSGLVPIENRAPLYHADAAQKALDGLIAQCAAEPACHAAYPDIRGDLAAVQTRLRAGPVVVRAAHPATEAPVDVRLSDAAFADGLRVMLYSDERARQVPLLLRRAREGDLRPFAEAAMRSSRALKQSLRLGLLLSASCGEDVWRIRPGEVAAATRGRFIGDSRVRGQMAACSVWPRGTMPKDYYAPFHSDVPTLLISGDLDPVTPPAWGDTMGKTLVNSVHVVVPGGHVPYVDCVIAMSRQFPSLARPTDLDRSCVAKMRRPAFALP
ncbi:alpha/beta hydrolase [Caulobacter mirabilis]|uniref:Alpha/beta hydrolase n=1 Tax=Caulobacter mirabilis TaxID=69666 RepID=A0A2D2AZY3_9CAUL|nr:alpha/beta hydrolase [Caulobacter mirabilis]ATQ43544.1 alpha/beta hydrolase [Caulobacter mirabilis]